MSRAKSGLNNKLSDIRGFTLAELLIVIAIIMILAGFGFVAVTSSQRRLKLKEADEAAREIFMAAQNYLTAAWADGDLSKQRPSETYYGDLLSGSLYKTKSYVKEDGNRETTPILSELLLPLGSIDEHVRSEGSYVVVYDKKNAVILHAFYSELGNGITSDNNLIDATIADNFNGTSGIGSLTQQQRIDAARTNAVDGKPNYIGYYGAAQAEAATEATQLERPSVKVHNGEHLWVEIIDPNAGDVSVTLSGLTSGEKITTTLKKTSGEANADSGSTGQFYYAVSEKTVSGKNYKIYSVLLDSITDGRDRHFAAQFSGTDVTGSGAAARFADQLVNKAQGFIPGENLIVSVSTDNKISSRQIETSSAVFNSLFGGQLQMEDDNSYTALITNGRHLQNLSKDVSGVDNRVISTTESFIISAAKLQKNISWSEDTQYTSETFWGNIKSDRQTYSHLPYADSKFIGSGTEKNIRFLDGTQSSEGSFAAINANYQAIPGKETQLSIYSDDTDSSGGSTKDTYKLIDFVMDVGKDDSSVGLFGTVGSGRSLIVRDVLIVNPLTQKGTGTSINAGALVGKNAGALTVTNCGDYVAAPINRIEKVAGSDTYKDKGKGNEVLTQEQAFKRLTEIAAEAYEAGEYKLATEPGSGVGIHVTSGTAGGLIGSSTSTLTLEKSFAAVPVVAETGDGSTAGGLIGSVSGTATINGCYSGGHTEESGAYSKTRYNVTAASGTAGGLIGDSSSGTATISYCYSTCSVYGTTAGGFLGNAGGTIDTCYTTGLVSGTGNNAFIGSGNPSFNHTSYYYEIVNEVTNETTGVISYKGSGVSEANAAKVIALDKDMATYNAFVGSATDWKQASPYDVGLLTYYSFKYPLKTVEQLGQSVETGDLVKKHYGDWPAPELFVINQSGSSA